MPDSPLQTRPPPPPGSTERLGIRHLMLWTLCSAMQLALARATFTSYGLAEATVKLHMLPWIWYSMAAGVHTSVVVLLIVRRSQSGVIADEFHPGYWIAILSLLSITGNATIRLLGGADIGVVSTVLWLGLRGLQLTVTVIAIGGSREGYWKLYFALGFLLAILHYLAVPLASRAFPMQKFVYAVMAVRLAYMALRTALLVFGVLFDVRDKVRRDTLHRFAVAAQFGLDGGIVVQVIASWLLMSN